MPRIIWPKDPGTPVYSCYWCDKEVNEEIEVEIWSTEEQVMCIAHWCGKCTKHLEVVDMDPQL